MIIEGAKMLVCPSCAKFSSSTWHPEKNNSSIRSDQSPSKRVFNSSRRTRANRSLHSNLELIDDFPKVVREARERLGLDHDTLGRKIREKVSVLQKIESGKLNPDTDLARKLEHELRIKILSPPQQVEYSEDTSVKPQQLTFGDMVSIRKKDQRSEQ
jgi:putative transcription factor